MSLTAKIDTPGLILPSKHGLWASSYHLIHPSDNSDTVTYNGKGSPEQDYELNIWPEPSNALPLLDPHTGKEINFRVGLGFTYSLDCPSGSVGCFFPCSAGYAAQDPDSPEFVAPVDAGCDTDETYYPSLMTYSISSSTFNHMHKDYWASAERGLRNRRDAELERRLLLGDCVEDNSNVKLNPYLSESSANSGVVTLGGGAVSLSRAIGLLDEALSGCRAGIGMVHAPVPVAAFWQAAGFVDSEVIDYGDGMGARSVLRTRTKGNVVVAGPGYAAATGPNAAVPAAGNAWVYATSMVNLVWDKIRLTPENKDFNSTTRYYTNDVIVRADQLIGAFYEPCCLYAVLVDLNDAV